LLCMDEVEFKLTSLLHATIAMDKNAVANKLLARVCIVGRCSNIKKVLAN